MDGAWTGFLASSWTWTGLDNWAPLEIFWQQPINFARFYLYHKFRLSSRNVLRRALSVFKYTYTIAYAIIMLIKIDYEKKTASLIWKIFWTGWTGFGRGCPSHWTGLASTYITAGHSDYVNKFTQFLT